MTENDIATKNTVPKCEAVNSAVMRYIRWKHASTEQQIN